MCGVVEKTSLGMNIVYSSTSSPNLVKHHFLKIFHEWVLTCSNFFKALKKCIGYAGSEAGGALGRSGSHPLGENAEH